MATGLKRDVPAAVFGDAFADVFAADRDAANRFALLLCRDHHVAEDVVAEAFARTWVHWERGRVDDPRA